MTNKPYNNKERNRNWFRYKLLWSLAPVWHPPTNSQQHHVTIPRNLKLLYKHWCVYYTSLGQPGTQQPHLCSQLCLVNLVTGLYVWVWLIRYSVCYPAFVPCGIHLSWRQRVLAWPGFSFVLVKGSYSLVIAPALVFQDSCSDSDCSRRTICRI